MAHWKSMTETEWLYAFDLEGKERVVQIEKVVGGTLIGEGGRKTKKPCVHFKGVPKPLALNATNAKMISSVVGSPDVEKWPGQWVTLFPTQCQSPKGETVDCIRIRPKAPAAPVAA